MLGLLVLLLPTRAHAATTWYVDSNTSICCNLSDPGGCPGTETEPFCTIQDPIYESTCTWVTACNDPDIILVRPGTYIGRNDELKFGNKRIVLRSTDGAAATTIQAKVFITHQQGRETVLDGFTISTSVKGAGVWCVNTAPVIQNNVITNVTGVGTGIHLFLSDALVTNNTITGNDGTGIELFGSDATISFNTISYNLGGGIQVGTSDALITDNVIGPGNEAISGAGIWVGLADLNMRTLIVRCLIEGNIATGQGGGIAVNGWGTVWLVNSIVRNNSANMTDGKGGGLYVNGQPLAAGARYTDDPICEHTVVCSVKIQNCLFDCNSAAQGGGAYFNVHSDDAIANTTFRGNTASDQGGAFAANHACVSVHNSVLWDNSPSEIALLAGSPVVAIAYSILDGGCPGGCSGSGACTCGLQVLDQDPVFVAADPTCTVEGNYGLLETSPAIDSGNNSLVLADFADLDNNSDTTEKTPLDLDDLPRFLDYPGVVDSGIGGSGHTAVVDMGAYEFPCYQVAPPKPEPALRPSSELECPGGPASQFCERGQCFCLCNDDDECTADTDDGQYWLGQCNSGVCYAAKPRYLSVIPQNQGVETALRVRPTVLPPPFDEFVGDSWWVGDPVRYCENSGNGVATGSAPNFGCEPAPGLDERVFQGSTLQCTPAPVDWFGTCDTENMECVAPLSEYGNPCTTDVECDTGAGGNGVCSPVCVGDGMRDGLACDQDSECVTVLHIFDENIVPSKSGNWGAFYEIQAIHESCPIDVEANYSTPITLRTSLWGDSIVDQLFYPNSAPNDFSYYNVNDNVAINDVLSLLNKFQNLGTAIITARADLFGAVDPKGLPDQIIEINDILQALFAFTAVNYPPPAIPQEPDPTCP